MWEREKYKLSSINIPKKFLLILDILKLLFPEVKKIKEQIFAQKKCYWERKWKKPK